MTDRERDQTENPPIDESTYGGSASETGGLYDDAGPTIANPAGDTMSEEEERDERPQRLMARRAAPSASATATSSRPRASRP